MVSWWFSALENQQQTSGQLQRPDRLSGTATCPRTPSINVPKHEGHVSLQPGEVLHTASSETTQYSWKQVFKVEKGKQTSCWFWKEWQLQLCQLHPAVDASTPGRQIYYSGRLSSAEGGAPHAGVSTAVPVTSGGHSEMPRGSARKGQQCKLHQCGTGHLYNATPPKKKVNKPPPLNRILGGFRQRAQGQLFGGKKSKLVAVSQFTPARSLASWLESTFCYTVVAEASAGDKCAVCTSEAIVLNPCCLPAVSTQL